MKNKVITKLCMSPRTHATTKQGREKTMLCKWAWQGKVQLKIKVSIVQFSTNHSVHSLQSLAMNIRLDDEIDAAAAKSNILLQFERVIVISFWMKLTLPLSVRKPCSHTSEYHSCDVKTAT